MRNCVLIVLVLFFIGGKAQRIGNYVANGSFEEYYDCSMFSNSLQQVKHWLSIDSSSLGAIYNAICNTRVPINGTGYQYPKTGNACVVSTFYWLNSNLLRGYLKNRLKYNLQAGKTYCVKFYINVTNASTYGIDGFGAYFGGNEIDTITKSNVPLSYIIPQVQNPQGNIITDTLNWVAITGTFTANGTEKYALIGNFLADNDVDTLMINSMYLPQIYADVNIDDVSCIPIDLEAYAGRDTTIFIGDSVHIGREPDFAIDTGCVWYKLPSTTAIDTISGMWVKPPIGTHTYVVRQELECSSLKWDTVVVNVKNDVGIGELKDESLELRVYPNPANGMLNVESPLTPKGGTVTIFDVLGKNILSQQLELKNGKGEIDVSELMNGIYTLKFTDSKKRSAVKKLVINR
ncbi:MAG: T9SS type A sorting domain-containing protein [Bacteroidetes bacterium]|nr:T9SS type A sorting domain-containing protein [Bacteroidota bacterium]